MRMFAEYSDWSMKPVKYTVDRAGEITVSNVPAGLVNALWLRRLDGTMEKIDVNRGQWGAGVALPKRFEGENILVFSL